MNILKQYISKDVCENIINDYLMLSKDDIINNYNTILEELTETFIFSGKYKKKYNYIKYQTSNILNNYHRVNKNIQFLEKNQSYMKLLHKTTKVNNLSILFYNKLSQHIRDDELEYFKNKLNYFINHFI